MGIIGAERSPPHSKNNKKTGIVQAGGWGAAASRRRRGSCLDGCGASGDGAQPVVGGVPRQLHQDVHAVPPYQLRQLWLGQPCHVVPLSARSQHLLPDLLGFGIGRWHA
jgi:hypothetical protein